MRKEGDSNPRNALGVYTLSRHVGVTPTTLITNSLQTFHSKPAVYSQFVSLQILYIRDIPVRSEARTLAGQQPEGRNAVVPDQVREP